MDYDFRFQDEEVKLEVPEEQEVPEEAPKEPEVTEDNTLDEETKSKYLTIYDAIMFEDKYEREVKLGKKYSAVFSTRSADADVKVARQLDGMNFQTISAYQTMSAVMTMAYSLVELNGKNLRDMSTGDRFEYIKGKSSHLIELLSKHMVEFDKLVREALMYGEVNF